MNSSCTCLGFDEDTSCTKNLHDFAPTPWPLKANACTYRCGRCNLYNSHNVLQSRDNGNEKPGPNNPKLSENYPTSEKKQGLF